MVEGIIFGLKAILLIEALTNAVKNWGIFDRPRNWLISRSDFLRRKLSCFECSGFEIAFLVCCYLAYFEQPLVTYVIIFHRLASLLHIGVDYLDAVRAKKEGEI